MVFLDANIVLELLLLNRRKRQIVRQLVDDLDEAMAISSLTAHLVLHFGRLESIADDLLHASLDRFTILPVTSDNYYWARQHEAGKDFEDALQVSVALRAKCTKFLTLDRALARNYAKNYPDVAFISP